VSGAIFIALNVLLAWIARCKEFIESLVYVDDSFGLEEEGCIEEYPLYGDSYPTQQTKLLKLWDEVSIC